MKHTQLSTKRSNFKVAIIVAFLVAACVAGGTVFALSTFNNNPKEEETPTVSTTPPDAQPEQSPIPMTSDDPSEARPLQYEGENPNTLETLTGVISFSGSDSEKYMLRLNIDQALASGVCRLSLSSINGGSYVAEANIIPTGSAYSSCEGFDIPLRSLSGSNEWSVEITIESDNKTGKITGDIKL